MFCFTICPFDAYCQSKKEIIFLPGGGDKSTQVKDIEKAASLLQRLEK